MINRDVFQRDPVVSKLVNDGVVTVTESATSKEIQTLRAELEDFVCEGQYKDGLIRILESYLDNAGTMSQPGIWVSGFFGSGKSHLLKMLRHLWVNTKFESDGATARELAQLPIEIRDLLKELDTLGKRCGGLHAAGGTLPSGGGKSLRLAILGIVFRSKGLPESLPQARFCMWLQENGIYDDMESIIARSGKELTEELHHLYASPLIAKALLEVDPGFARDLKEVRATIRAQFPDVDDITNSEFIRIMRQVLSVNGELPCTTIVLDEVQLFIGDSASRSYEVQEVAEALSKQMDSRVLLIGSGQTALSGKVPLLQRLKDRFPVPVELSDADVETVTRRVVLAKKADKRKAIEDTLAAYSGSIDRQLAGTRIAPRSEDRGTLVEDYPLLPVRRRFWEHVLRTVDVHGTSSQLRTQLRIVHDSVQKIAKEPLGTVIPADEIFNQLQPDLLRTGTLIREIDEIIRNLDDGTPEGILAQRLCGLIFLIRKQPQEEVADIGVRATADMLADLIVSDLSCDDVTLRAQVPEVLERLVDEGKLIKINDEYSLQTRESSEWEREYRNRLTRLSSNTIGIAAERGKLLNQACTDMLSKIKLLQGDSKEPRRVTLHFGSEFPLEQETDICLWIRDGWSEKESTVISDARAAGSDDPTIFIYIPRASSEDLTRAINEYEAARQTLDIKGIPTTDAGKDARKAMATRMEAAKSTRDTIIQELINNARVFQGGGQERLELIIEDKVRAAAAASLDRLFARFRDADDSRWPIVINRARNNDQGAFGAVGWNEGPEKHPVCLAILAEMGSGKTGREIREAFTKSPYGWPRDAIDAALITLFATGHLRAIHKGTELGRGQLEQGKIPTTSFRTETITIDAQSRMRLRKLFQEASIRYTPGEDSTAAKELLEHLMDLANQAGGAPPLPPKPSTAHIVEMQGCVGNEQLAAILEEEETLRKQLTDWATLADLAAKRQKAWANLQTMLQHAKELSEAKEHQRQADAVYAERRLLEEADPIRDIYWDLAKLLRTGIRDAYSGLEIAYNQAMLDLEANEVWQRISSADKQSILEAEGIASLPTLDIEDDEALIRTLQETPLQHWKLRTDALAQQFNNAIIRAAKLLQPKTQKIRLPRATLATEADVVAWVDKIQKQLLEKVKNGPIVVS